MEKLNWSSKEWHFSLTCSEQGLTSLDISCEPIIAPKRNHCPANGFLEQGRKQIEEFLAGKRKAFDLPLDLKELTKFQLGVLQALAEIPFGETKTYGDLARAINNPKAVRAVGGALGKNPLPLILPCHRVLASNGPGGFSLGLEMKRQFLKMEGIEAF